MYRLCFYYPVISKYIKQTLLRNEQRISVWLKHTATICSNIPHATDKVRPRESTFPQPVKRSVDFMHGSAPIPYPLPNLHLSSALSLLYCGGGIITTSSLSLIALCRPYIKASPCLRFLLRLSFSLFHSFDLFSSL